MNINVLFYKCAYLHTIRVRIVQQLNGKIQNFPIVNITY